MVLKTALWVKKQPAEIWPIYLYQSTGYIFVWRRERDSNPRYAINVYTLSRRAPSATRTPLQESEFGANFHKTHSAKTALLLFLEAQD